MCELIVRYICGFICAGFFFRFIFDLFIIAIAIGWYLS